MWTRLIVAAFALLVAARAVAIEAQLYEITEQQRTILNDVMRTDGELTQDIHRRFWADMPADTDPKQWRRTRQALERTFSLDLRRMRAMYLSMRATLRNHAPTIDPSYARAQAEFESIDLADAADRQTLRDKVRREDRLFRQQLEQVARGAPLHRGEEEIRMTPELIDAVLEGIDEDYARARRLLDPVWRGEP